MEVVHPMKALIRLVGRNESDQNKNKNIEA